MKKIFLIIFAFVLCLSVGCGKNAGQHYAPNVVNNADAQTETTVINQTESNLQIDVASDEGIVWHCIEEDEYFYNGKRYYVNYSRLIQKSVEDSDGNYLGDLPVGSGDWIGYSHYICGINAYTAVLRIVDLDKELDNCIIYEKDLNTFFSPAELSYAVDGCTSGNLLCAMNGWVYYTSNPLSLYLDYPIDHNILMRVRYDGSETEEICNGTQYKFPGAGLFSEASHVVDGVIYTPVYDLLYEQYAYAEIRDASLTVVPCDSDYYFSFFESDWTLRASD